MIKPPLSICLFIIFGNLGGQSDRMAMEVLTIKALHMGAARLFAFSCRVDALKFTVFSPLFRRVVRSVHSVHPDHSNHSGRNARVERGKGSNGLVALSCFSRKLPDQSSASGLPHRRRSLRTLLYAEKSGGGKDAEYLAYAWSME